MSRSYMDYDKETSGDKVKRYLKVCGLSFAGALIGCILIILLFCFLDWEYYALYFLAGMGAMVFYGAFMKKEERHWYDHFGVVITAFLATLLGQIVNYMIYYAPEWGSPAFSELSVFERTMQAYFTNPSFDTLANGIVTDGGAFSVWSVYFISLIAVVVGLYVTFLFVLASDNPREKKSKKRK